MIWESRCIALHFVVSKASPAVSGRCVKTAPSWQGRRLRWWPRSSGYSSGIAPTNLLQSRSALNKKDSEKREKKEWKVKSWLHTFTLNVLYFFISLHEHLPPFLRLRSHWLRQVTESCGIWQIKRLWRTDTNHYPSPALTIWMFKTKMSLCVWADLWLVVS